MTANKTALRIVIADDHPIVLRGLVNVFEAQPDFRVVAACGEGFAALAAIRKYSPDIAILDFRMPNLSGLEILDKIVEEEIPTKIAFLTASASADYVLAAITRRAQAIMLKDLPPETLVNSIRSIAAGRRLVAPEIIQTAIGNEDQRLGEITRIVKDLTAREREVMRFVSKGLSNKEIAKLMALEEGTIKTHLHHVFEKTGLKNRTLLAALALRLDGLG